MLPYDGMFYNWPINEVARLLAFLLDTGVTLSALSIQIGDTLFLTHSLLTLSSRGVALEVNSSAVG